MKQIPFILSLAYKDRIEKLCARLPTLGLKYFVCYIVFNNGQAFVLSNIFHMLIPYYTDNFYKEDNSFKKIITANLAYYLCDRISSVGNRFEIALEERFSVFRSYYIIRNSPECQFVFGAIKNKKFDNYEEIYKRTIRDFENFCCDFVDKFIDVIKYYNPSYHNSIILNDEGYRRNLIKSRGAKEEKLTAREIECLYLAALGKSSEESALMLGISRLTVNSYRDEAKRKLNASNITNAVFEAVKYGYIGSFHKIWERPDAVSINGFKIVNSMDSVKEQILCNENNLLLLNRQV